MLRCCVRRQQLLFLFPDAHLTWLCLLCKTTPDCSVTHAWPSPREILKALNAPSVLVVSQDSFYKSLTPEQSKAVSGCPNACHPPPPSPTRARGIRGKHNPPLLSHSVVPRHPILTASRSELTLSARDVHIQAFENNYDFDCPGAFDWDVLKKCIAELKHGRSVEIPVYSFVEHQRMKETQYLYGASVVILEGIFILSDPELRDLMDMKIFGGWRF